MSHIFTLTRPGDQTGYAAVCLCGWQGRTFAPNHRCSGEPCGDVDGYWNAKRAAEAAASRDGIDHLNQQAVPDA